VLTYWYGNVPEETEYFLHRLHQPWLTFVLVAPFMSFALPLFVLIPKASKWSGTVAVPISMVIFVAQWVTYLIVVMPETADTNKWLELPMAAEVGGFLAVGGIFLLSIATYASRAYMVPVGDPLLREALAEHH
jgi:hypothetical protein